MLKRMYYFQYYFQMDKLSIFQYFKNASLILNLSQNLNLNLSQNLSLNQSLNRNQSQNQNLRIVFQIQSVTTNLADKKQSEMEVPAPKDLCSSTTLAISTTSTITDILFLNY